MTTVHYRVTRESGLLVPGFSKRIRFEDSVAIDGVTYWWGIRIGSFDVQPASECGLPDDAARCLRYRTWPVIDVLGQQVAPAHGSPRCEGTIRLPRGRRLRFCRFSLDLV